MQHKEGRVVSEIAKTHLAGRSPFLGFLLLSGLKITPETETFLQSKIITF